MSGGVVALDSGATLGINDCLDRFAEEGFDVGTDDIVPKRSGTLGRVFDNELASVDPDFSSITRLTARLAVEWGLVEGNAVSAFTRWSDADERCGSVGVLVTVEGRFFGCIWRSKFILGGHSAVRRLFALGSTRSLLRFFHCDFIAVDIDCNSFLGADLLGHFKWEAEGVV